jgi:hypothetical protein
MSEFQMPEVHVGDMVAFHMDGDSSTDHSAAIVTSVGDQRISLAVILDGSYNIQPQNGVPHVNDPWVLQASDNSMGAWQHLDEFVNGKGAESEASPQKKTIAVKKTASSS